MLRVRRAREAGGSRPERSVWSGEFELTTGELPVPLPATSTGGTFDAARVLVRLLGEPVGFVDVGVSEGAIRLPELYSEIDRGLSERIAAELQRRSLAAVPAAEVTRYRSADESNCVDGPPVTIAVCTRDRLPLLQRTLDGIRGLHYERLEVIVVDSAPSDGATRALVQRLAASDARIRYVLEPVAGASRARNVALRESSTDVIAYVDDDIVVDRGWLDGVLRGFARADDVACVTGLIASASLELPVEQYFDGRVSWASSCDHRLYRFTPGPLDSPLHPYNPGSFGGSGNVAFRTQILRELGGFDEVLGAGMPAAGGEDLDLFVRTLHGGWAISYEPTALVWHAHRVDYASLRRQMFGYGSGLTAYLFKHLVASDTRRHVMSRVGYGLFHARRLWQRSRGSRDHSGAPAGVATAELRGMAAGPWLYLRSRRAAGTGHGAQASSRSRMDSIS